MITPDIHPMIEARYGEPVTGHEIFAPISCEEVYSGEKGETEIIYDFGQNLSGVVEFEAEGETGQIIRICHAEALEHGKLYRTNLRSAKQEICYYCRDGKQTYGNRASPIWVSAILVSVE